MKQPKPGHMWYFADEAGDPTFYSKRGKLSVGQEGCSPILILGFIKTTNPEPIRKAVRKLQQEVTSDPYFQNRKSLAQTAIAFHANTDLWEIKYLFFKLIATFDIRVQFVVARKIERIFIEYDKRNQNAFYDHIMSCLFHSALHRYEHNHVYFATRGSRKRQAPITAAITNGRARFERYYGVSVNTSLTVQPQTPSHEPCLSVIDYMNWALYQAYVKRDMNYFNTIRHQVSLVADMYDTEKGHNRWYDRGNPFDIEKTTPLQLVPS